MNVYNEQTIDISIIICAYNASDTIHKAVNSVLSQDGIHLEVIIIDDGSTDDTYQICLEMQHKFKQIVVCQQKNSGPSIARNKGLSIARGQYISFLDADDYIEPNSYTKLLGILDRENSDIVIFDYIREDEAGKAVDDNGLRVKEIPKDELNISDFLISSALGRTDDSSSEKMFLGSVWRCVYKRSLFFENNILFHRHISYAEDLIINLQLWSKAKKISFIEEPFYHYVFKQNSLSSFHNTYKEDIWERLQKTDLEIKRVLSKLKLLNKDQNRFRLNTRCRVFVEECLSAICNGDLGRNDKIKCIKDIVGNMRVRNCYKNVKVYKISHRMLRTAILCQSNIMIRMYYWSVNKRRGGSCKIF